jgi:hypothetical protein
MEVVPNASRLLAHHVARRLGISSRMVRHLARTGRLPARKDGPKIWVFDPDAVERERRRREYARP